MLNKCTIIQRVYESAEGGYKATIKVLDVETGEVMSDRTFRYKNSDMLLAHYHSTQRGHDEARMLGYEHVQIFDSNFNENYRKHYEGEIL